jgi:hypothetical protein
MNRIVLIFNLLVINAAFLNAQADIEKRIQTDMIMAENGSTVQITEGVFKMSKSISMDGKKNVTIKGKGIDQNNEL